MPKSIVGLDFGHGVIRAAEVTAGAGKRKPVLHRYHEVEVPLDAIREGVVTDPDAVVSALKWLWAVGDFGTKRVVIGMGSQQVLIRELTLPSMPLKHIKESLPFRVQELLPLPVEDAVLDFYPIEEFEAEGERRIRGLLVAATRESVLANIAAARAAGLRTEEVDLIPFALTRAHLPWGAEGTKVIVHVGAVSTNVIVAERGVPQFIRMLPTGSRDLTQALADRLGVRPDEAEELKRRIGITADEDDPESVAVARVNAEGARDVVQAVKTTIAFFENSHPQTRVEGLVLSGGGAMLRGLGDQLGAAIGLPVSVGRVDESFSVGSAVDEASFLAAGTAPTVALALTMRGAA